jgi:hypothetical protein
MSETSKGTSEVSGTEVELGPIDYLVVEWPAEKQPTGEAFPLLVDLVDRGLIRVLDLAFVRKEMDGSVVALDLKDLDLAGNPELAVFEGASSGLLGEDDYPRRRRRSSPDARPRSSSTRTLGRHRSPRRCAAAAPSSSRTAGSP